MLLIQQLGVVKMLLQQGEGVILIQQQGVVKMLLQQGEEVLKLLLLQL